MVNLLSPNDLEQLRRAMVSGQEISLKLTEAGELSDAFWDVNLDDYGQHHKSRASVGVRHAGAAGAELRMRIQLPIFPQRV